MKICRRLLVAVALAACCAPLLAADAGSPEKRAHIEQLMEMTHALELGKQMSSIIVAQMTHVIKATNPRIPQELLDVLPAIVDDVVAENMPSLKERSIALYDKYFSDDEVTQMIQFYSTDLGKKTIRVMPSLMRESMMNGQQWGQSLTPEVMRRVRERFKKAGVDL